MILVVGATGMLGGLIARRLLEQGEEVRILVRDDSVSERLAARGLGTRAAELVAAGAQPVTGDLKDVASLARATDGVEAVISTANSAIRGGEDNPDTVERLGHANLVRAAGEAGVGHLVYVSAMMADPGSPSAFLSGKAEAASTVAGSVIPFTVLAPDAFMDVWLARLIGRPFTEGGPIQIVGDGRRRHSFIAMEDVAAFAIASLRHPSARDKTLVIGGPEPISMREAAETYLRVLEKPVDIVHIAPDDPRVQDIPGGFMAVAFETFDSEVDMSGLYETFGIEGTNLEQYLRSCDRIALFD